MSAMMLLETAATRARGLTKDIQAAQQAACETHPLLATVLTETVAKAERLERRLSIYASALRHTEPTLAALDAAILLAARDWLNRTHWSGCPMTVEPRSAEQRRDIECAIANHYDGGIAGFLRDQMLESTPYSQGPWHVAEHDLRVWTDLGVLAQIVSCGNRAEDLANARLIAAAPELLAACWAAEHWLAAEEANPGETKPDEILRVVRAAITAAGGAS